MVYVIAQIKIKEGMIGEFIGIFKANVPAVIKEKGCIDYQPAVDFKTDNPAQKLESNVVTVIEKWDSIEDLNAHSNSPHMKSYREKVKDMVLDVSLKILKDA